MGEIIQGNFPREDSPLTGAALMEETTRAILNLEKAAAEKEASNTEESRRKEREASSYLASLLNKREMGPQEREQAYRRAREFNEQLSGEAAREE